MQPIVPETLRSLFHFRQSHTGLYNECSHGSCVDLALSIAFYHETQSAVQEPEGEGVADEGLDAGASKGCGEIMTTETDVKQRLAALRGALAAATKACPCSLGPDTCCKTCLGNEAASNTGDLHVACENGCHATGEVAAFPNFRSQETCAFCGGACRPPPEGDNSPCEDCDDTGLQGGAGGMAAALASLSKGEASHVLRLLNPKASMSWGWGSEPMPSADQILETTLRLVCDIKNLEVPDASS